MQQPSTYQGRAKYVGPSLLLHWIFHSKKEVSSIDQITFWLTCLLHLLLIVHQARILNIYYIANGPPPFSTFSSSSLLFRPSTSKSSFTKSYLPVFVRLLPWQIEVKIIQLWETVWGSLLSVLMLLPVIFLHLVSHDLSHYSC